MSLSRRAKRGISVFQKIQMSMKRAMYHLSSKNMIKLDTTPHADPLLVDLAAKAMAILIENGEKANANSEVVPEVQNDAVTAGAQERTEFDPPVQQQNSEKGTEGGPLGASGGVQ